MAFQQSLLAFQSNAFQEIAPVIPSGGSGASKTGLDYSKRRDIKTKKASQRRRRR